MSGKGRQTARKPATKFAHLRKKMEKAKKDGQIPVVVARGDRKEPIAILYWSDFMGMMDNAEISEKPYDPMVAPDKAKGSI